MQGYPDTCRLNGIQKSIAVYGQAFQMKSDHINMVGVGGIVPDSLSFQFLNIGESAILHRYIFSAQRHELLHFFNLVQSD